MKFYEQQQIPERLQNLFESKLIEKQSLLVYKERIQISKEKSQEIRLWTEEIHYYIFDNEKTFEYKETVSSVFSILENTLEVTDGDIKLWQKYEKEYRNIQKSYKRNSSSSPTDSSAPSGNSNFLCKVMVDYLKLMKNFIIKLNEDPILKDTTGFLGSILIILNIASPEKTSVFAATFIIEAVKFFIDKSLEELEKRCESKAGKVL